MVIVITGLVTGIVATFLVYPINAYFDTADRAAMSDAGDLALRRIQREVRRALPNSVRTTVSGAASLYLELVPTLVAGRFENSTSANCFTATKCASLVSLGPTIVSAHDYQGKKLVVYNASNNSSGGCATSSVYCGNNLVTITDSTAATGSPAKGSFTFSPTVQINSTGSTTARRFQVVEGPVSYVCDPTARTLTRYWGYGFQTAQPTTFTAGSSALVADHVSCSFTYQTGSLQHAMLGMTLTATAAGSTDSATLYYEVTVNNVP